LKKTIKYIIIILIIVLILLLIGIQINSTYSYSTGFSGTSISIIYKYFFLYIDDSDIGIVDWAFGVIKKENKKHIFHAFYHHQNDFIINQFPKAYYQIQWGDRKYLIRNDRIVTFCNKINQGYEPRDGMGFFPLLNDIRMPPKAYGEPNIPIEYKKYLLESPLKLVVLSSDSTEVKLSSLKNKEILIGWEFFKSDPFYSCTINRVDSTGIYGIIDTLLSSRMKIGDTLSTELPFEMVSF